MPSALNTTSLHSKGSHSNLWCRHAWTYILKSVYSPITWCIRIGRWAKTKCLAIMLNNGDRVMDMLVMGNNTGITEYNSRILLHWRHSKEACIWNKVILHVKVCYPFVVQQNLWSRQLMDCFVDKENGMEGPCKLLISHIACELLTWLSPCCCSLHAIILSFPARFQFVHVTLAIPPATEFSSSIDFVQELYFINHSCI